MKWLPIDRDDNGFATEECLKEIFALHEAEVSILLLTNHEKKHRIEHDIFESYEDMYDWYYDIKEDDSYTHYLPIPKLEV